MPMVHTMESTTVIMEIITENTMIMPSKRLQQLGFPFQLVGLVKEPTVMFHWTLDPLLLQEKGVLTK